MSHRWAFRGLLSRYVRVLNFKVSCSDLIMRVHHDVIKWKHYPRYWPIVRGIHRSAVNSPHKCQRREALMLFLICAWINGWVNNREAGDLGRHSAHYDVIVMTLVVFVHYDFRITMNIKFTTCLFLSPISDYINIYIYIYKGEIHNSYVCHLNVYIYL